MRPHTLYIVLLSSVELTACATFRPPEISYDDDPKPAVFQGEPPRPVGVVEIPKPLPLPGQLKAVPGGSALGPEPKNPTDRVAKANEAARVQPTRNGYINAVQVYPYATGALYQVYTAPGQVTDIALQEGEQLVGSGPVAAGDTVRWIIGDTESGTGQTKRVHIEVKPDPSRSRHQSRHQHRPPHLSSRAALHREGLHGLGLLAVPAGPTDCVAPA